MYGKVLTVNRTANLYYVCTEDNSTFLCRTMTFPARNVLGFTTLSDPSAVYHYLRRSRVRRIDGLSTSSFVRNQQAPWPLEFAGEHIEIFRLMVL